MYIIKTGIASHTTPVITPTAVPLIGLSNKCNFIFFFSTNQKMRVKNIIANSGIISAHNLHIAGFSEDDNGNIEDNIAHPRKNPINFIIVIAIFFKRNILQNKYPLKLRFADNKYSTFSCRKQS